MLQPIIGRIEFGNTREGNALSVLQDALIDKSMWMSEVMKKEDEIEALKAEIKRLKRGCKVKK